MRKKQEREGREEKRKKKRVGRPNEKKKKQEKKRRKAEERREKDYRLEPPLFHRQCQRHHKPPLLPLKATANDSEQAPPLQAIFSSSSVPVFGCSFSFACRT
jgi:hypothetical protein